jgi:hypothetical protein
LLFKRIVIITSLVNAFGCLSTHFDSMNNETITLSC